MTATLPAKRLPIAERLALIKQLGQPVPVPVYAPDGRLWFVEPDIYVEAVASGKISGSSRQ